MNKQKLNIFLVFFCMIVSISLIGCSAINKSQNYLQPKEITTGIDAIIKTIPAEFALDLEFALYRAKENTPQLLKALNAVKGEERVSMAFLISQMPMYDLTTLKANFLIDNVQLAHHSMQQVSWGKDIPPDIFLNNILPYVNVNETRDTWRQDFYERYIQVALEKETIHDTVLYLNKKAFEDFHVSYHATKRPKPDQSPAESIKVGYASCTGLSIFISDVLRSVGIPTRIVGTPQWVDKSGNHTWVEVWDAGEWHHIGASESEEYDEAWFNDLASQANTADPIHRIYAVSFKRTAQLFPTIWDPFVDYVYAIDVTQHYQHLQKK